MGEYLLANFGPYLEMSTALNISGAFIWKLGHLADNRAREMYGNLLLSSEAEFSGKEDVTAKEREEYFGQLKEKAEDSKKKFRIHKYVAVSLVVASGFFSFAALAAIGLFPDYKLSLYSVIGIFVLTLGGGVIGFSMFALQYYRVRKRVEIERKAFSDWLKVFGDRISDLQERSAQLSKTQPADSGHGPRDHSD